MNKKLLGIALMAPFVVGVLGSIGYALYLGGTMAVSFLAAVGVVGAFLYGMYIYHN